MTFNTELWNGQAPGAEGYQIERSLRFNSSDSAYLSRTPASAGSRTTWTWAGWVKRSALGTSQQIFGGNQSTNPYTIINFDNDDTFRLLDSPSSTKYNTQAVFRDVSAWYHIVIACDTTQSTTADRLKIYVNGTESPLTVTSAFSQNYETQINTTTEHRIGRWLSTFGLYLDGYLADIHFIDGQALDPTSFGEFDANGVWQPKAYTGTYPGNSFHLPFSDNSTAAALGTDTSGNSNTWTVNNISVTAGSGNDSLVDTPTNYGTDTGAGGEVRGNYCTWNALAKGSDCTLSNGNLDVAWGSAGSTTQGSATIGISSGKWYWETTITASSASPTNAVLGITTKPFNDSEYPGYSATSWGYRGSDGQKWTNTSGSSYGASYANGDVVGVAFDADNGTLTFYKNGSSQGTAFTGLTSGPYFPAIGDQSSSQTFSAASNFGQRPFAYTAPSGFKALCTTNLDAPLVAKPSTAFDVKLYTATGAPQTISGMNLSPDLVWIKDRGNAQWHILTDSVRGVNSQLFSNDTSPQGGQTDRITSFNSDGFTLGADTGGGVNNAGFGPFVAWTWDAGSSTVTNTDGSITSQVRANQTAGFSIVTYTGNGSAGATIGHGLGVAPQMIIVKNRDAADAWQVYHSANTRNPDTDYLVLNTTAATADNINRWNDTAPTSTVFSLGDGVEVNTNTEDYVAYCWTGLVGYSSFGSYTGNSSTDGPFVYTGFKPRWLLVKDIDSTKSWDIMDTARSTYNPTSNNLLPNVTNAEGIWTGVDFLSNGFKLRGTSPNVNQVRKYIYAAFAENPFALNARAR